VASTNALTDSASFLNEGDDGTILL
jgi:hypothetical protein